MYTNLGGIFGVLLLVSLLFSNKVYSANDTDHCVMYGECGKNDFGLPLNCYYTGPAKTLNPAGQKLLARYCSHLLQDAGKGIGTCCDEAQLRSFDSSIQLAANFLKRCPACIRNLIRHLCDFTCSPTQSTFINVTSTIEIKGNVSVKSVQVYISNNYIDGTYNSCKQVSVPSTGQLALDVMCGEYGASKCSAKRWFTYMGSTDGNPYVPFQMDYMNTSEPIDKFVPLNPKVLSCGEAVDKNTPACSCVDCETSCPVPKPQPTPTGPFLIASFDGYAVIMFSVFVIGSLLFLLSIFFCPTKSAIVGLVRGEGADEIRASVGRRLAGTTRTSRIALEADSEESPLQSKRSSMLHCLHTAVSVLSFSYMLAWFMSNNYYFKIFI